MIKNYIIGFIIAFLLTSAAFMLAMSDLFNNKIAIVGILIAGVAQIIVHLHFFLHLDYASRARWNIYTLLFAILLIAFFIGGTVWVMFTLNNRMM